MTAAAQAMLVLEAALFSVAPATVTWYKDGVSLKHSSDVRIIDDGRSQSLSILEAKRSDAGKYECRAKNKFGEARTQCTVTIKGESATESGGRKRTLLDGLLSTIYRFFRPEREGEGRR